ncbi:hypothetical protein ColLi_13555 [Colletotrichum liriopes]|uniref:MYND-type domain-containing protein n=1 Tax=Colletotrichum liriopes TaxID=708192 RepID=A0AA37LZM2_9PEZI|nr:hypothetical protein ColLi_13555 [Colletotrichum liriopes]
MAATPAQGPPPTSSPASPAAALGFVTGFDNTETFPFFDKLDSDQGLAGTRFYDEPDDHWCLLAEIHHVEHFPRDSLLARDCEGRPFVIAFYPDANRAGDINTSRLQPGHTIAILYANQHFFLDGTDGVFPVGLDALFRIGADCCNYGGPTGGEQKKCHGCGREGVGLVRCGRCAFFYYCNKVCQEVGWKRKGHRLACQVVADPAFKALLTLPRVRFTDRFRFPT